MADFSQLPKQWLIAGANPGPVVAGTEDSFAGLTLQAADDLPILRILDAAGGDCGRVIGWVFHNGRFPRQTGDVLTLAQGETPEDLYRALGGRFVMLWQGPGGLALREDAAGNLPLVYAPALGAAASTVTVLDQIGTLPPHAEANAIFEFPKRRGFLPFGLTARQGAHRLGPNQSLSWPDFIAQRVWPDSDFCTRPEMTEAEVRADVARVGDIVASHFAAILTQGETVLYLSGGHDSRMVLAAALSLGPAALAQLSCETLDTKDGLDIHVAREVAGIAGLAHRSIAVKPSDPAAVTAWLTRAGYAVYDFVAQAGETMRAHAPKHHPVSGTGAELGRGSNWAKEDFSTHSPLDVTTLLERLRIPDQPVVRAAAEAWMAGLPAGADRFMVLDLAKIEQIHAQWAGAGIYGHPLSRPSHQPFAGAQISEILLRLPPDYRFKNQIFGDYLAHLAPALVGIPVNQARGAARLKFWRYELKQMVPTQVKRWLRPFR